MPAVTQRIDNYLGGVSRQSDDKKLPGQVRECLNAYPDPTFGLTKRTGFKWIKNLGTGTTYDGGKWFYIARTAEERYIGVITPKPNSGYGGISSRHYGHYNNGIVRKTTPLASGVSIQDNKQLEIPLPKQDADETMWNGKALKMQDLYQMDKEEIIDLCEDNPVGVGCLISEEIVGNRA